MVGFQVGPIFYSVGSGNFLHSFFSTVAYQIEGNDWGSLYPVLMNGLYKEELTYDLAEEALEELHLIKDELASLPPEAVIWDIEDLDKKPPWGDNIADTITDLSNYFITSDGKNLIGVLEKALNTSISVQRNIKIRSL